MEIIIKIQIEGDEIKDVRVETETEVFEQDGPGVRFSGSDYARFFNESCSAWTKDAKFNLMFLQRQQRYANDILRSRGYLFLNEVYDMLDIPKTKTGQIVGWIYDEDHPSEYNFVDFGLHGQQNENFVNGFENVVLLDFNVYGNILDLI